MKALKVFGHILVVLLLTVLTQVGGLIWLISLWIGIKTKKKKRFVFPTVYLVFNLLIIPLIAPWFGRTQLPVFNSIMKPQSYIYALAFRNYVTPELESVLMKASIDLLHLGIHVNYLDANFPFIDGFPLLPHLSHNDGKKIDIAFQYKTKSGKPTNKKSSLLGYGNYATTNNSTSDYCKSKGYWQYNITRHLKITTNSDLVLDKENTKTLIQGLLYRAENEKLFIEPYLKEELGLQNYSEIRFHGCQAVRHDDHIHLQIK